MWFENSFKNLKKYPEGIQLKEVTFVFSIAEEISNSGKASVFVGFEKSKTKAYSSTRTITFDFTKNIVNRPYPSRFEWKEIGVNLQLEFAGLILKQIADVILISRATGVKLKTTIFEDSFTIKKSNTGSLQFKLLNEKAEVSANRKKSKTVTNNVKIVFEPVKEKKIV